MFQSDASLQKAFKIRMHTIISNMV